MPHPSIFTEEDFLAAYDAHADDIFRHCHLQVADRELSKELMTRTFQELWLFSARGNAVDNLKIFLFRAANKLIEERGEEVVAATVPEELGASLSFLHELSPRHRKVCILHHVDGFSADEIGEILGGSPRAYRATLRDIANRFSLLIAHAA